MRWLGRLSSPRFRRRALKVGSPARGRCRGRAREHLLLEHGDGRRDAAAREADLYVPPIPIKMAPAERRAVIADRRALRRDRGAARARRARLRARRAEPRGATTRDEWRTGDIPVVPYPVDDARWKFDYSYANEIGLQVAVFPRPGAAVRPAVFNLSLRSVGAGAKRALARRLLVAARRWWQRSRRAAPTARRSGSTSRSGRARRPASARSGCSCPRRWSRSRCSSPCRAVRDRARALAPRAEGVRRVAARPRTRARARRRRARRRAARPARTAGE